MNKQARENLIIQLKNALAKQPIKLAYLYGSYARGQENDKSDIDIAVVLENTDEKMVFGFPADIFIHIPGKEIDLRVINEKTEPVFLRSVLKDRLLLFAKDEKTRTNFETRAMKTFFDTQHLRNLNFYYLKKSLKEGGYGGRPTNFRKLA